tara:strand:- start:811 stop:1725 length:915 start_codon:yes stop_codon:yes gene_type:complete
MGVGSILLQIFIPLMELIGPMMPGETFPHFFTMELFQRALLASFMVSITAGVLGSYLLIRNLALIGDGLAHVSFGGVAVGIVLGAASPLWYALVFSIISAILIYEMQSREILTGDASIAIFLTGMLAFGLVILRIWGGGITTDIEGYLFGNMLMVDEASLDLISMICIISLILISFIGSGLLASTIDPLSARVQGIPVQAIGLLFSVITAAVVVSMVQIIGTLLVTALLVTPAATAQLVGRSFRSCMIFTQVFGISAVIIGLYLSAELDTGSGTMIAVVSATIFGIVAIIQSIVKISLRSSKTN